MSLLYVCPWVAEATAGTPAELTSGLTGNTYSTKTQGERTQPAARAAGEGTYIIATGQDQLLSTAM